MTVQTGRTFLVRIGDGEVSEAFTALAGLGSANLSIGNTSIDTTIPDVTTPSNMLVQALAAGKKAISVSGSGKFTTAGATQTRFVTLLTSESPFANFQILVPGFGTFEGNFHIDSFQWGGEQEGEATFECSLSSNGAVTFTAV